MHVTRAWFASLATLALSGCALGYGVQAARGQWALSRASEPIDAVLTRADTSERLRAQLQTVQAVRQFAVRELGLPDNRSYTRYAALGRRYVVWNVVATPELALTPRHWCFPVAGCVSYRGYFNERSARKFADRLRRRGDDAMVGGVPAYSTLGYFADPVPDTLLRYGELAVAETILHELAHQLLYVPGDSDFNEAFASVVAEQGMRRWLATPARAADLERYEIDLAASAEFDDLLAAARDELAQLYGSQRPLQQQRDAKRARLTKLAADLHSVAQRIGRPSVYEEWAQSGLNNAHLAAVATYRRCAPGLRREFAAAGSNFANFYARVTALAKLSNAARAAAVCAPSPTTR